MTNSASSGIRIASCRSDGKCPECGLMQAGAPWPMLDYCACRICPPCLHLHLRDLLTEALRLLGEARTSRDTRSKNSPHMLITKIMWRQVCEEGDACRAMLDEILALLGIEAPTKDGSENVASVVANALEALREERDAALRDVEMWKAKAIRVSGEADALEKERDAALQKAEFWKTSDEAWVDVAGRAMALLGHPNSSDLIGVAEKIVERMAEVEAQRDDAIRERDEAQAKLVEEREAMTSISGELVQAQVKVAKERDSYRAALEECGELRSEARERADRAEALLREVQQPIINVAVAAKEYGDREASREWYALLAKIREFTR